MSDELNMELEVLENELKEARDAYEMSDSRRHKKELYDKIKRMEERFKVLNMHSAIEECRDLQLSDY